MGLDGARRRAGRSARDDVARARGALAKQDLFARVESVNDFPTAVGSLERIGFAALALAATPSDAHSACSPSQVSSWRALRPRPRHALSSAATPCSIAAPMRQKPSASGRHLPMVMLVAVTASGLEGSELDSRLTHNREHESLLTGLGRTRAACLRRSEARGSAGDFDALGRAAEHRRALMHASMIEAGPRDHVLRAGVGGRDRARARVRNQGRPAYITMDAARTSMSSQRPELANTWKRRCWRCPGVQRIIACEAGPDAYLMDPEMNVQTALAQTGEHETARHTPESRK